MEKELRKSYVKFIVDSTPHYGRNNGIAYSVSNICNLDSMYDGLEDLTLLNCYSMKTYGKWWSSNSLKRFNSISNDSTFNYSTDFIEVIFGKELIPDTLTIVEPLIYGSLCGVFVLNKSNSWIQVWTKNDSSTLNKTHNEIYFFKIKLSINFPVKYARLEFNHDHQPYYYEIRTLFIEGWDSHDDTVLEESDQVSYDPTDSNSTEEKDLTKINFFDQMPEEIIFKIFQNLSIFDVCRTALVCKKFKKLCYDPTLYMEIDFQPYWNKVNALTFIWLVDRCFALKRLSLNWCKNISSLILCGFIRICCQNLVTLKLSNCNFLTSSILTSITETCLNLEELEMKNSSRKNLTPKDFELLANLTQLTWLDISESLIDDETLITIIKKCNRLKHLGLANCDNITNIDGVLYEASTELKCLRSLDLWRINCLTTLGLEIIGNSWPDLESLDIGWCLSLDPVNDSIRVLASSCPKLKRLILAGIRSIQNEDINVIVNSCPAIEQLDLLGKSEITIESVLYILSKAQKLRLLDVSYCEHIHPKIKLPTSNNIDIDIKRYNKG